MATLTLLYFIQLWYRRITILSTVAYIYINQNFLHFCRCRPTNYITYLLNIYSIIIVYSVHNYYWFFGLSFSQRNIICVHENYILHIEALEFVPTNTVTFITTILLINSSKCKAIQFICVHIYSSLRSLFAKHQHC